MKALSANLQPGTVYLVEGTLQQCTWFLPPYRSKVLHQPTMEEMRSVCEQYQEELNIVYIMPYTLDVKNPVYGISKIYPDDATYVFIVLEEYIKKQGIKELVKNLGDSVEYIKLTPENYKVEDIPEISKELSEWEYLTLRDRRELLDYYYGYPTTLLQTLKRGSYELEDDTRNLKQLVYTLGTKDGIEEWSSIPLKDLGNYLYRIVTYNYRGKTYSTCGLQYYLNLCYLDRSSPSHQIVTSEVIENRNGINSVLGVYIKPFLDACTKYNKSSHLSILGLFALFCYTVNTIYGRQIKVEDSSKGKEYLAMYLDLNSKLLWESFVAML